MDTNYQRIILLGSSKLLYDCAKIVCEAHQDIPILIIETSPSDMCDRFEKQLEIVRILKKDELMQYLRGIKQNTIVFSIMNKYIIDRDVVLKENLTLINLHHALLPKHPGRNAEAWAIYEGDSEAGITWHYILPGVDDGDIIIQETIGITNDTTSFSLLKECNELAIAGLKKILPLNNLSEMKAVQQEKLVNRTIHYSYEKPNDGYLNLEWDIDQMSRFLRSMNYGKLYVMGNPKVVYNGTEFILNKYKIIESDLENSEKISIIERDGKMDLLINLGKKAIKLLNVKEVQ